MLPWIVVITALACVATASAPFCQPSDSCWPTTAQWHDFNASISGSLIAVAPEGAPCYSGSPSCATIQAQWSNATWRADQPGAMQSPNWEDDDAGNGCFNPNAPCAQGNIPPFAVVVNRQSDIASALQFAIQHNIRVVVKSSGHEYLGRSTAPSALMIWTHRLRSVVISPQFQACPADTPQPAVVVAAGSQWADVYNAVEPAGYNVVGGSAVTVSACGGYTLGGGHSFMSPAHGLAVDNVLQFSAVLANGSNVIASACYNADLFWALRGGGGGTFAVVSSCTYAMHPIPKAGVTGMLVLLYLLQGPASVSMIINHTLATSPQLTSPAKFGVVWGGYFYTGSNFFEAVFVCNGTQAAANASLASFVAFVGQHPDHFYVANYSVTSYASMNMWHRAIDGGDSTGAVSVLGSQLVPSSVCTNTDQRTAAVEALTTIASQTTLLGHLVAGGAVSTADPMSKATSVTPAWRAATIHYVVGAGWATNATLATQAVVIAQVAAWTDVFRAVFPNSGAYWSESQYDDPGWQAAYWGVSNYARLQQIKRAYDPSGVFVCHHCVELPK